MGVDVNLIVSGRIVQNPLQIEISFGLTPKQKKTQINITQEAFFRFWIQSARRKHTQAIARMDVKTYKLFPVQS